MSSEAGYYRHPSIHGDSIVFVCEDDLWSVAAAGGTARRLTANPGTVAFPLYSPDGKRIAFTGKDEGPLDVYVTDGEGGPARRITWLGSFTYTVGWSPDASEVYLASDWRQPFRGYSHLHAVPVSGGAPRPLRYGPARAISMEPGGSGVVIGRNAGDPARWKRYRGGTAGTLWIDRRGTGGFTQLVRLEGNLASPMWIGGRIYFLSDHDGYGNIYSCTPTGRDIRRHTDHEDFYVRFPSTDGRRIVYHAGADLFLFDPAAGVGSKRIDVRIASPRSQRNRKFVSAARYMEGFDLHPKGHSIATVNRGGVHTMHLWEGAPARLTNAPASRHRLARWLPDGARLVAVTDEGGEEGLIVLDSLGRAKAKRIDGDFGRVVHLAPAPAGADRVAVTNQRQELILVDLATGRAKTVTRSPHGRIDGISWSPDGRWLAFGYPDTRRTCQIRILESATGKVTPVTRSGFQDVRPSFDPEGKYLFFISGRVFDPVSDSHYFDLGFPRGSLPFLITLRREQVSPFSLTQAAPRPPGITGNADAAHAGAASKEAANKEREAEGAPAPQRVEIDLDGIADRIIAFPVPEGRYGRILGARGRALFSSFPVEGTLESGWVELGEPPAKGRLEGYDFGELKTELVQDRITDFTLSTDARAIGIRTGNRVRVVAASHKADQRSVPDLPGRDSGWVDVERLRVSILPGEEWKQMFREAWRLQRDQFWTPDMSGIDWGAVHDRYLPLVDRVASRAEFSDLLWEMQGELGTSHCYELGGDYRPEPTWFQGFLGADLELDPKTGTWKVARIARGDTWDEKRSAPLAAPGLNVRIGDEILAVGGVPVGREVSPYERLVHCAGQDVQITLRGARGAASGKAARGRKAGKAVPQVRRITVRTLRDEYYIRYRDWVEANRAKVHEASGGRVGYIHIPDMGAFGYAEFHRHFLSEVDHEGLVIDVRWNGGGNVSQLLLEKLLRRRVGYDANRWGQPEPYPTDSPMGPMVALTNEYAGSDGDIFSHCFKLYKLGPLIGKRTWGGVVGIWPRHFLVDGTVTTQPEFAFWFEDVGWGVENYGTDPDIDSEIRPQDHAIGRDTQLERALSEITRIMRKRRARIPDLANRPRLAPERLPKRR